MQIRPNTGFTLVELLITIALIAVVAGFAVPQFGDMIERNRVTSTTNSVVGLLNYARSEAIRRNVRVSVNFTVNPVEARLQNGTVIRVVEPLESGTSVDISTPGGGTPDEVVFRSNGMTEPPEDGSGAAEEVLVRICSGDATGREIVVDPGGRMNTRAPSTACP